ncbi:MAG: hypothetical protein HUJ61_06660 [Bacilli bacterium]|nr:hypothetical protein [Bacilli bacterium]
MKKYLFIVIELLLSIMFYFISNNLLIGLLSFILMSGFTIFFIRLSNKEDYKDKQKEHLFISTFTSYYLKGEPLVKCYQNAVKEEGSVIFLLENETEEEVKERLVDLQKIYSDAEYSLFIQAILNEKRRANDLFLIHLMRHSNKMRDHEHEAEENIKKKFYEQLMLAISVPCSILFLRVLMWNYYSYFLSNFINIISLGFISIFISIYIVILLYQYLKGVKNDEK